MSDPVYGVVASYRAKQVLVAKRTSDLIKAQWAQVDPANPIGSWSRQIPAAVNITRKGMRASAAGSTQFVSLTMRAQGATPDPVGTVVASAFADSAADGRPLGSLLYLPGMNADTAIRGGMDTTQALAQAEQQLMMLVLTEVTDAGRGGVSAGMLADKTVTGYFRQPGSAACARCAILAGIWSRTYEGASFERHPFCQCTAVPSSEHYKTNTTAPSTQSYFDSLSTQRQDLTFGKGNAEMIRAGADPAAVINARRGMSGPGFNWTTTEGTTRRATYGGYKTNPDGSLTKRAKGDKAPPRLTPSAINRLSSSREDAVAMLRKYGYLN